MEIVIAGAGDIGFHLAELLSYQQQNITLIDTDPRVLHYAAHHLDVLTIKGDAASVATLEQAGAAKAHLVLAVTTSENTNLITAILAKKMGARKTIARVKKAEYLAEDQRALFRELGVDNLISPRQLAAKEISRLVKQTTFTNIFEFEDGKFSLLGVTLAADNPLVGIRLSELPTKTQQVHLRLMAILRGHRTLIPRGKTVLQKNDHIYFISDPANREGLHQLFEDKPLDVKNIMIVGGGDLGYVTALLLEKDYAVTLIEQNRNRCKLLGENLSKTMVINGDYGDFDLMEAEGLAQMDVFIALTQNSETNIIACLTADNYGVRRTIAQVENKEYVHISQNIGVDTLINMKLIAANNIFRFVRQGQIEAITSLQGVDAEVIEFVVHKNNQLTRRPLKDLHFPEKALIGGVIRGEQSIIPDGEFQLQLNDKVIVFALPEAITKLEKLFR